MGTILITLDINAYNTNQVAYAVLNGSMSDASTTEGDKKLALMQTNLKVKRVFVHVSANTKDQNTVISFRGDVNAIGPVTVPNGQTGDFDSGPLDQTVTPDLRLDWKVDSSSSTLGSISAVAIAQCEDA